MSFGFIKRGLYVWWIQWFFQLDPHVDPGVPEWLYHYPPCGSSSWIHMWIQVFRNGCIIILHQRLPCDGRSCDFCGHLVYSVLVPMFFRLVLMSRRVMCVISVDLIFFRLVLRSWRVKIFDVGSDGFISPFPSKPRTTTD
jgi:hypothetical protein